MMSYFVLFLYFSVIMNCAFSNTAPSRVHEAKLSDEKHFDDSEHHNPEFDHEAFLGKETAKEFEVLAPEESRRRLGVIFERIDTDNDTYVDEIELIKWIKFVLQRYVREDAEKQWKTLVTDPSDSLVTWEQYRKVTYGYATDMSDDAGTQKGPDADIYKDMMRKDRRRWDFVDDDKDGKLNKEQFTKFLHPSDYDDMRDLVIEETMEDIDKDHDGQVTLDEYMGDMYGELLSAKEGEPDFVQMERETFQTHRDSNKDGVLDRDEVYKWIFPEQYNHAEAEAKHLIHEADADKDGRLTKEEVLDKYDVFVGAQVTNYGESLNRHDEF